MSEGKATPDELEEHRSSHSSEVPVEIEIKNEASVNENENKSGGLYSDYEKEVYSQIFDDLYENLPETETGGEIIEFIPSKSESLMDLVYSFKVRISCREVRKSPKAVETSPFKLLNSFMKNARRRGFGAVDNILFPNVESKLRNIVTIIWVICELVFLSVGTVLSIVAISTPESVSIYTWVHFGFACIGFILSGIDAIIFFRSCSNCKAHSSDNSIHEGDTQNLYNTETETSGTEGGNLSCSKRKCRKCHALKRSAEICRMILTEVIVTPLLICDLFEIFDSQGYKTDAGHLDRVGFALFVIDTLATAFFMYIARVLLLAVAVYSMHKTQTSRSNDDSESKSKLSKRALYFVIFISVHITLHLIGHFIMLVAVGAQIGLDNLSIMPRLPTIETGPNNYVASSSAVYMCFAVCVLPIAGVLSFFIYANFWFQECPMSVAADLLNIIQTPGGKEIIEFSQTCKNTKEGFEKIVNKLERKNALLHRQYENFVNTGMNTKLFLPFRNPVFIVFSLIYTALQISFFVSAGIGYLNVTNIDVIPGAEWYLIHIIIGGIFFAIVNSYVFILALVWFTVITLFIAIQLLEILLFLFWLCNTCDKFMDDPANAIDSLQRENLEERVNCISCVALQRC